MSPRVIPGRGWRRVLLWLAALDALLLGLAARDHMRARELERVVRARTVEAYADAIARAGEERPRLLFNLGNLYLEDGARLHEAAALRAALGYYREALRLEPGLLKAARNYEVAQRTLDALIPPREPREPRPPDRVSPSQMPLLPTDI